MIEINTNIDVAVGLADELKQATWSQHRQAEKSGIIASILQQSVELKSYALYLRNLHHVYEGLEQLPSVSNNGGTVHQFIDKKLHRSPSLSNDLQLIAGKNWADLPLLSSAKDYRQRIDQLINPKQTSEPPIAILGHVYVRYLGDLNGGQVLRRLLAKNLQLENSALSFYAFTQIKDLQQYRTCYRDKLNHLDVEDNERNSIITEAIAGFKFNITLSNAISSFTQ